ncbi:MAG: response regulator [Sedimentisphaerales bacterium]|nr:response regulator [Sedimentisphaerales bacterium]
MVVLVQANVLTVGLDGRNEALRELPIQVIAMRSGVEAARSLKNEKVDSVISNWDLDDMPDGRFLRAFRAVKPDVPIIVFVKDGDMEQEIAARSLGVSAVLSQNTSNELFCRTVANVLGLRNLESIKAICLAESQERSHPKVKSGK